MTIKEQDQFRGFLYDAVTDIMIKDGPDVHIDGSDILVDFIIAIVEGDAETWINDYRTIRMI